MERARNVCIAGNSFFQGRDLGYGYRTGQMLAQVISSYTIKITVQIGKVANMVIDNLWDIIDQEP